MPETQNHATALVTGAALRLGRAITLDLAKRGWRIGVHYQTSGGEAESLVEEIERLGSQAIALSADLTSEAQLRGLVQSCVEKLGPPTCLINNAARFEWDSIATLDWAGWQAELDVNLRAPIFLTQEFARTLPKDASGCVINMIDQRVWRLTPEFFSYTIAKSALWTATRTLAQALAPRIRVNAIGPGPVLPSLRQSQADFERECRATPLGRAATVEEVCRAVRFLLDSPSVTGQMIALDSGQHLAWVARQGEKPPGSPVVQGLEAAGLKAILPPYAMSQEKPESASSSLMSRTRKALSGVETGPSVIARHAKTAPGGPGVYRMIDAAGEVLYVGKARGLKKRVQSYARAGSHNNRIAAMIANTASMEFVTTPSETEALLLEANLIKRLKPRYNVVLRDDKSFPFILIARDHAFPQILKHRGARSRKGDYFGPFASAGAVGRTINTLQRAFLLRSCSDAYFETRLRPCLLYQIKRCSAPCTGEISEADYAALVDEALRFLTGESDEVKRRMHKLMDDASLKQDYERAASFRDRLTALSNVQSHQGINPQNVKDADVFSAHQEAGQTSIQVFFFRTGNNWGNRAYFPRADKSLSVEELLESFVAQFYDDKPPPKLVLLSHEIAGRRLLGEALSLRAGHKIRVEAPQRGEKRELVTHALVNAREALARRLAESSSQAAIFARLAELFDLEETPERIEVFDNSHISGTNPVGAMIVAGLEGFIRNQYRKFNIRSEDLAPGDDYAMMREMLTRRFSKLARDKDPANGWAAPDLVLIDGGPGQLSAAVSVLDELGLSEIKLAAIAKGPDRNAGRERIYLKGREPLLLEPRDPVLYCIQKLRDEAHRFAIGAHRARRKKAMQTSPLDEIQGIGPSRKRALLQHFGSAKAVSRAGIADLAAVGGISAQMAKVIYDHFHEGAR